MPTPPNILLIHTDQHRFDCVGANGHPLVQTPHLNQLAAEGIRFTHAFSPIPVCIPARNCLMYGQWSSEHLSIANWNTEAPRPARGSTPTVSECLCDADYYLAHAGKWHIHPDRGPLDFGYHDEFPDSDYTDWRESEGYSPRPATNGWQGEADKDIPHEASRLAWSARNVIALLESASTRNTPFFIHWETNEPHLPNIVPEPFASLYQPEHIPPWPSFPDPLTGKPYIQSQQQRTWEVDGWTWNEWAPIVARYLGEISLLDSQIGLILNTLERLGLSQNTLVIYTPDHGDLCGGHGMVDKHYVLYDDIVRVPLIVRWPERILANRTSDDFVSNALDLATTLCDVAGTQVPESFRGRNLLPLFTDSGYKPRQDIFAAYHGNQFGLYSQRMVRSKRWKYIWNATAEDEPGEIQNRATDQSCREHLEFLRGRLIYWMEVTSDPLLNGWNRNQLTKNLTQ